MNQQMHIGKATNTAVGCRLNGVTRKISLPKLSATLFLWLLTGLSVACKGTAGEESAASKTWETYEVEPPSESLINDLQVRSAVYPHVECLPVDSDSMKIDQSLFDMSDPQDPKLCIWHHPAACVPEGLSYAEVWSCDTVRTLGPSWFIEPEQRFVTDEKILRDEAFKTELAWVTSQVASSGCSCCHASEKSGYASYFDIDAPGNWTDTLTMTGVVMAAGLADEHKYLGYLPPEDNFGFDRETTIFATTDIPRMRAFFQAEFDRRGGTADDIQTARDTFVQINGSLFEEPGDCGPGEGLNEDGKLVWKGGEVRQVYLQEVGSNNPGSPPNLDKPEGTVWALYANPNDDAFASGTIEPGIIPENGYQAVPADTSTSPQLEEGQQYRLFVTPDFLRSNQSNCIFTYGETAVDSSTQVCGSDNIVCAQVVMPETLQETPEKLLVALYRNVPPIGPPDVFPPFSVDAPTLEANMPFDVKLDAAVTGTFHIFAALYMPGGGLASWQPLSGVDYIAQSEPIELDGSGVILEVPLEFTLVE